MPVVPAQCTAGMGHSVSQNCPMKLPSQAQVELAASYVPCSQSLQRASTLLWG